MTNEKQTTIEKQASIEGLGLHTGKLSRLTFKPAPVDAGLVFYRTDIPDASPVRADIENLLNTEKYPRRTSIGNETFEVHTTEHLLSALYATGINNLIIEIEGEECPGMDGSTKPFLEAIKSAVIKEQNKDRNILILKDPIYISDNGSHIIALPCDDFKVSYTLDYPDSLLKSQYASYKITPEIYEKEISIARTFCLKKEVEQLRKIGLGKGSDYNNTLVIDEKLGVIKNSFRVPDEPVRHKISDLIGDLALLGNPLSAHIIGIRSGHTLNTRLIRKIRNMQKKETVVGIDASKFNISSYSNMYVEDIEKIIPHRFPFLLVDKILDISETKAVGIKNTTINEWFFQGHFPGGPVMPGVLTVEAMAQLAGVLVLSKEENHGKRAYFMSIDKVKFRKAIRPGDQIIMETEVIKLKSRVGQVQGKAYVDGKLACEALLTFTVVEAPNE